MTTKKIENKLEHRLQRYGEKTGYIVGDAILCCANGCKKGKWHEDYYKENGEWWERYKDGKWQDERPGYPEGGCYNCGGFGVLAHKAKCPEDDCDTEVWHSVCPMTAYEGKEYNAFCGTTMVYTAAKGSICKECAESKYGGSRNIFESSGTRDKQTQSGEDSDN